MAFIKRILSNKSLFVAYLLLGLTLSCSTTSKTITIIGEAQRTKDGFYVDGYVLTFEEIKKYNPDYMQRDYEGVQLKITGKVKEHEMTDTSKEGEIMQAREGNTKFIYHIETIEVISNDK